MSSHGLVPDLFDPRYLNIQDVQGNVAPFPTLIPYEHYDRNVTVYKMETDHQVFMGLIQDFTDRFVRFDGRELWTWIVQWRVDGKSANAAGAAESCRVPLSSKRLRLWTDSLHPGTQPTSQSQGSVSHASRPQSSISTPRARDAEMVTVQRQLVDPELVQEEEILRALLDIVQADPSLVPNFIEILYQAIDHYEGDGFALKCALQEEIPSLWDFEKLPVAPAGLENVHNAETETGENVQGEVVEESERSTYQEKKYGLAIPSLEDPASPLLVNIPQEKQKRTKYFAACYKSRARAMDLLLKAGMELGQIANFDPEQEAHPLGTSREMKDSQESTDGLRFCREEMGEWAMFRRRRAPASPPKQREPLMSDRLDFEAEQAAYRARMEATSSTTAVGEGQRGGGHLAVPAPLIPATPSSALLPGVQAQTAFLGVGRGTPEPELLESDPDPIESVPGVFRGLLKSKLLSEVPCAVDDENSGSEDDEYPDTHSEAMGSDEHSDGSDDSDSGGDTDSDVTVTQSGAQSVPQSVPQSLPQTIVQSVPRAIAQVVPQAPADPDAMQIDPPESQSICSVANFIQNLSAQQIAGFAPMLNAGLRQQILPRSTAQSSSLQSASAHPAQGSSTQSSSTASNMVGTPSRPPTQASGFLHHLGGSAPIPGSSLLARRAGNIAPLVNGGATTNANIRPQHLRPLAPVTHSSLSPGLQGLSVTNNTTSNTPTHKPTHTSLSPGLQNLSFGTATNQTIPPVPIPTQPSTPFQHHNPSLLATGPITPFLPPGPPPLHFPQATVPNIAIPTLSFPHTTLPNIIISSPPASALAPSRPGLTRLRLPTAIKTSPIEAIDKFNALGSPVPAADGGIPVLLHFGGVIDAGADHGNGDGDVGMDDGVKKGSKTERGERDLERTDAIMLGYIQPGSTYITLTTAIFLPAAVGELLRRRVRAGGYVALETYIASPPQYPQYPPTHPPSFPFSHSNPIHNPHPRTPHAHAYTKLRTAHTLMTRTADREQDLTKRWRVSKGLMKEKGRGAVWEGWAVDVATGVGMGWEERRGGGMGVGMTPGIGVVVNVDVGGEVGWAEWARRREVEALERGVQ